MGATKFNIKPRINKLVDNNMKYFGVSWFLSCHGITKEITQYRRLKIQIASFKHASRIKIKTSLEKTT